MTQRTLTNAELENTVHLVDPSRDALYKYEKSTQDAQNEAKPWKKDPHYFQSIRISASALIKMVTHARSGGSQEIMGLMQGYTIGTAFIVTDAFRLPVEGTETRVNAQEEAYEYMVHFLELSREAGQMENAVGWYHSHPGYGCWLSGVDVTTQITQQYQDPFVAVVIDPDQTVSAGRVEIGAFRTFPEDYKSGGTGTDADGFQTIPLAKMEDFGAYSDRYYALEVSHFKSSLDNKLLEALWNKYWVGTLSNSPLLTNREYGTKQMAELALKIRQTGGRGSAQGPRLGMEGKKKIEQLDKIVRAGEKIAAEEQSGLLAAEVKEWLFGGQGGA